MKNFKRILTVLLAITLLLTLIACGEKEPTPAPDVTCTNHVDKNNDCKCDTCKKSLKHKDEDEDCVCDKCDKTLDCVDDDEDGVCDKCGEELEGGSSEDGIVLIEAEELLFQVVLGADVDLETRIYIDEIAGRIEELGGELTVRNPNSRTADIFELAGLDRIVNIEGRESKKSQRKVNKK